jgi:tetratricopeptide (TPR) repeat protein
VHPILARIQRERALLALVRMSAVRVPADPVTDPAFDGLGDDAKARRVKAHAAALEEQARWRQVAIEALEEAIGLAPDTPETYDAQRRLMALQRNDPEARRARMQAGQDAYLAGREHQRAGRLLDALRAYREAVGLVEGYGPAHFGVLQTTYELLRRPRGTGDAVVEREQEDAWLDQAWHSLGVLDRLDPLSQLPERWLYRGLLHRYRYRRDADEGLRHAARTAFRRYLELESARGREEGTEIDMARTFLADMTRRDDG